MVFTQWTLILLGRDFRFGRRYKGEPLSGTRRVVTLYHETVVSATYYVLA